ncbi:efflux RND transporter periplasmic adaptor subunit [Aliifodinibius sp. S!AR15-10]|uniref:efflux RND transporter periplasmic adaptor subunit n=1 Tax=Aliifodinibius sp. S!AR15-10 TaxID=2950437 RepID=UPI0028582CD1|nr:efflux RND transporter periplasmic adaptor subunit [Aliifodinibius sp. S!AR15-10]MDR8392033.1 efflux RND transporter periplasmic adaptor subunit [Aliifodinibius sp. S!AR15-10]
MNTLTSKLLVVFVIAGMITACSQEEQTAEQEELVKSVNVETVSIEPRLFQRYLRLVGTIESANDVHISAEVNGRIEQYFVEKGKQVRKGEPILKIDDDKLLQEKARLEAQTEQAKEQYDRLKRVFEEDSVGSEIDIINARASYRQSQSALESIKVDIENTTVRAPFDAILEDRLLEVGEMASTGATLVRLIGANNLKIVAGVPSRYSDVVNAGDQAEAWFDFQDSDTLNLSIDYVGQSIDPQARTFRVEMFLPRQTTNYKVDMIANVRLKTYEQQDAIVVGEEFVYQKDRGFVVYTVNENDQGNKIASEKVVKLGPSYENEVVVNSGLQPGDQLITVGSSFLQDSMRINIVANGSSQEFAQRN